MDEWSSGRNLSLPLPALKGAVIGIDASHYISQHLGLRSTREPLLVALGGFPFTLKNSIEKELRYLKSLDIVCVFVFNGLEFGKKDKRPRVETESAKAFERAWELYDQQQADQVVEAFSAAGMCFIYLLCCCCPLTVMVRNSWSRGILQIITANPFAKWCGLLSGTLQCCCSGKFYLYQLFDRAQPNAYAVSLALVSCQRSKSPLRWCLGSV